MKHPSQTDEPAWHRLLAEVRRRESKFIERLSALVEIESPTSSKRSVDRAQTVFADWASAAGGKIRWHRNEGWGDSVAIEFGEPPNRESGIMLLGHMDTVHETGTLAHMPLKITRKHLAQRTALLASMLL